jgi:catechol 2,3-dioxygenase-like lactoylglutathione lyase family enzyme
MRVEGVLAMTMVRDIDRALRFYRDILGFTVADESEDWVVFEEGVGLRVSREPLPDLNFAINSVHITLQVTDVRAAFAELTSTGIAFFVPPTDEGGAVFATLRDPEGNLIQLMQPG